MIPVCVSEGVKGVLTRTSIRGDARNHDCTRIANKGISKNFCQFTSSKGDVQLVIVKGSDALFQR
jgi:hypothetical protein